MLARAFIAVVVASLAWAPAANADPPSPRASSPSLFGEPSGYGTAYQWSTPIRLTLSSGIMPVGSMFPNCESREDAAGNSVGGIAVQKLTLLRLSANLVLTGFSRLGCPIDSAIGGAMTYASRLSSKSWLVLSSGIYGAPALPAALVYRGDAKTLGAVRADYVWQTARGSTRSVGLGATTSIGVGGRAGHNLITFGGAF